jgi:hypothetical protein
LTLWPLPWAKTRRHKTAEIDGGYFGGYVKPANLKEKRVDRRFARIIKAGRPAI